MSVQRLHNGAYYISDIINGRLVHMTYMGYTLREAKALFKQETWE